MTDGILEAMASTRSHPRKTKFIPFPFVHLLVSSSRKALCESDLHFNRQNGIFRQEVR